MRSTMLVTLPGSSSVSPAANNSIPRPFLPIHGKILLNLEREKTKGILLCSCFNITGGFLQGMCLVLRVPAQSGSRGRVRVKASDRDTGKGRGEESGLGECSCHKSSVGQ